MRSTDRVAYGPDRLAEYCNRDKRGKKRKKRKKPKTRSNIERGGKWQKREKKKKERRKKQAPDSCLSAHNPSPPTLTTTRARVWVYTISTYHHDSVQVHTHYTNILVSQGRCLSDSGTAASGYFCRTMYSVQNVVHTQQHVFLYGVSTYVPRCLGR